MAALWPAASGELPTAHRTRATQLVQDFDRGPASACNCSPAQELLGDETYHQKLRLLLMGSAVSSPRCWRAYFPLGGA